MLYTVGLLPRAMPEQVPFAYEIFKKGKERFVLAQSSSGSDSVSGHHRPSPVSSLNLLFPLFRFPSSDPFYPRTFSTAYKRAFSRTVTIEFIGVFDTVSSVGAIFPKVLPFSSDNHITKTFRHALALDEHRAVRVTNSHPAVVATSEIDADLRSWIRLW